MKVLKELLGRKIAVDGIIIETTGVAVACGTAALMPAPATT